MGKFKTTVLKELEKELGEDTKKIHKIFLEAILFAQEINRTERWETGFMTSNWRFSTKSDGPSLKRPSSKVNYLPHVSIRESIENASKWKLGDSGFINNDTEYISQHDRGTSHHTPVFFTTRIPMFIENEIRKIK